MKTFKILILFVGMMVCNETLAQSKLSEWMYIRGDKPVMFQIERTKEVGNKVYYKIYLKLNPEGPGFCTHELCYGYVVYLPIYEFDTVTNKGVATDLNFKIPKEFKGTYLVGEYFAVKKSESNGIILFWDNKINLPMEKNVATGEIKKHHPFLLGCVDTVRKGVKYSDHCNFKGFNESKAIEIK